MTLLLLLLACDGSTTKDSDAVTEETGTDSTDGTDDTQPSDDTQSPDDTAPTDDTSVTTETGETGPVDTAIPECGPEFTEGEPLLLGPWMTWNDVATPADGVVVSFQAKGDAYVCYGATEALGLRAEGYVDKTQHHVSLTDLPAGATTWYRVVIDGVATRPYSITTAPAEPAPYKFLVAADMQDLGNPEHRWNEIATTMVEQHGDAAFLLAPGDLVCDDNPECWHDFFASGDPLFSAIPIIPAVGNHETPTLASSPDHSTFLHYFDLPDASGDEALYSIRWGNTLLLTADSDVRTDMMPGTRQYDWIAGALDEAWNGGPSYDWIFASWHFPPYNVGVRQAHHQWEVRTMTELFDNRLDWHFSGHEHLYQRYVPMLHSGLAASSGEYGLSKDQGVGYMVMPAAGGTTQPNLVDADTREGDMLPLVAYPPIEEGQTVTPSEHGFVVVEIDGRTITITSWALGNDNLPREPYILDQISYTKPTL